MKKPIPKRIHIIGSVASGKTTLAKELSLKHNIPYYELDNVVWIRNMSGDIRRTEKEREDYLHKIIQSESWIIEGVHNDVWVSPSFQHADVILFLDPRYSTRTYRIMKRFLRQKLRIEKSHYKSTIKIFLMMFKWNRHFEEVGKSNFFEKYSMYHDKVLVVKNKKSLKSYFH